jgi:BirA family biotin operon repressor/biotin-[acetyl-CoA-carboxylase] ligase
VPTRETHATHAIALKTLRRDGRIALDQWPNASITPQALGLDVDTDNAYVPADVQLHDAVYLQGRITALQPTAVLKLYDVIGSTNTAMMQLAQQQSVANCVLLAEYQSAGKGRRGKVWVGDFARNIAMTVGYDFRCGLNELGGLSCVVGLAMVQLLEQNGIRAQIKWPNDVWVDEQKLVGILVELLPAREGVTAIVGVGLNVDLSIAQQQAIDQAVTSVRELGVATSRDDLVIGMFQCIMQSFELFARQGFAPFVSAFNAAHRLHDQPALVQVGGTIREGLVRGVDRNGALLFEEAGHIVPLSGGEVSLRPSKLTKS